MQGAADQQSFERDLASRQEVLDEQRTARLVGPRRLRGLEDRGDPAKGRHELARVVRADHPAAGRERERLENARVPDLLGAGGGIVRQPYEPEARHRHARLGEAAAHRVLVARGADGEQGVGLEAEPLADGGGDDGGLIVHGHDRVDREAPREPRDGLRARLRIREIEGDERIGRQLFERARSFGRAHELDAELGGGVDEGLGAIRRRGQEKQ